MTTISDCYESIYANNSQKTSSNNRKTASSKCKHPTQPEGYYDKGGNYVCTNTTGMLAWLECAKKHGSCAELSYFPGGIFKKAEFGYSVKKWNNANMIRSMFNLKRGAIHKCQTYITESNVDELLTPGKIIYFHENDVQR